MVSQLTATIKIGIRIDKNANANFDKWGLYY